jgi:raffinose/stachyose/melibiose transport system substrate-binding protein
VPTGTATGGGILYNKKVYEQLGLGVPTSWAEFEANNEKIKAAGITPVIATFGDTWTSQLFVLADYYNVEQDNPSFAADYTNNKSKYASTPAALAGFQRLSGRF